MIKYAFNELKENMARAYGRDLGISTKQSTEICREIRGMKLAKAKKLLSSVIKKEAAISMKRYNRDTAHKTGMAAGRFPVTAATEILKILNSVESNAQTKGLGKDLVIVHISAHKAVRPFHHGRKKRSKMKRTHIQVVLEEQKMENKK
ncbi:MAG: 50S ribosomal protein L22 [Candidatus Woesearchaeota archaeon]|nr:50S ribosomal protein L22 [Candidatus Woesearchaeota archaeon]